MALSSSTVWEVRAATGNDNNGGGWTAGATGTDFTQQAAAQLTLTDLATSGVVTTLTSVTGGFAATMVGDVIHIVSGTNFTAGFYQITVFTNSNTVTVDRAPSTAAGAAGTGSVGGALATLTTLATAMVASNKAYATGAFTTTATITFAQSVTTTSAAAPPTRLIGYGTTRGDATHATLTLQTNTGLTGLKATGTAFNFEQMDVDCASLGTSSGITVFTSGLVRSCKVMNYAMAGITLGSSSKAIDCEVTAGISGALAISASAVASVYILRCYVHDNACLAISAGTSNTIEWCLCTNNSGAGSDGINAAGICTILNNTIHNNGRDGIRMTTTQLPMSVRNNLLTNNAGFGITMDTAAALPASVLYDGNAYFSNTSGARNNADSTAGIYGVNPYVNVFDVTLSGSPYVGPTTGGTANFGLNNTTGAGKAARGSAQPGAFPGITTTKGALDMGAVQSGVGGSSTQISSGGPPYIIAST